MLRKLLSGNDRLIDVVRKVIQSNYLILFTVSLFLLLFILTLAATNALITSRDELSEIAYDQRINEDRTTVERSLSSYSQILDSGVSLIDSVDMSPEIWRRYIDSYQKLGVFPQTFMFGVSQSIDRRQVPAVEARLSEQYGRPISIFPLSDGDRKLSVVTYVERGDQPANNLGFNVTSLPDRAATFSKSTETGEVALGDEVKIINDYNKLEVSDRTALMFVAPYFKPGADTSSPSARRANIAGHVYLSLDSQQAFDSIFKDTDFQGSTLRIYRKNSSDKTPIYQTTGKQARGPWAETVTSYLSTFGQVYRLEYVFDRNQILSPLQIYAPILTFIAGALLSLILPALIHIVIRSRQNALRLSSERAIKEAQDELLSLASHQLRTPATATKQYIGMVLQGFAGNISRTQKDFLTKAYDSNERQLRVINDILHVAKLDAGRIVPSMKGFNITDVTKSVLEDYASEIKAANIKVRRRLGRATTVHGDQYMIRMIIENLISNAIKYTPPGGNIEVTTDKTGDMYRLSIRDTGVGIAKKDLDKLFKQFSRIPNERTGQVTGTGVGLYLAQNLASLHGGKIIVESKEHKGSTFTLELPKNM